MTDTEKRLAAELVELRAIVARQGAAIEQLILDRAATDRAALHAVECLIGAIWSELRRSSSELMATAVELRDAVLPVPPDRQPAHRSH